jgi:FlgD Ig-like domain
MRFAFAEIRSMGGFAAVLLAGAIGLPGHALADPFAITRWTVDGGGGPFVQVGGLIVGGTIGQPDAGLLIGRDFVISGGFWVPGAPIPVGVDDGDSPGPDPITYRLAIFPAAPNPLRLATRIAFELPDTRDGAVQVFDVRGALVRTVASGPFAPGPHQFEWDGVDAHGRRLAAGVYLVRVRLGTLQRTQKLVLMH